MYIVMEYNEENESFYETPLVVSIYKARCEEFIRIKKDELKSVKELYALMNDELKFIIDKNPNNIKKELNNYISLSNAEFIELIGVWSKELHAEIDKFIVKYNIED